MDVDPELVKAFDQRHEEFKDDKYIALETQICDVKDIQNTKKGVTGFWMRAMLGNDEVSHTISEKDRPILAYLEDVKLSLHEKGFGFDLEFIFEKNSYFKNLALKKSFVMGKSNVIEKCIGCKIEWNPGCDPTHAKKKKKKKGKNVTV